MDTKPHITIYEQLIIFRDQWLKKLNRSNNIYQIQPKNSNNDYMADYDMFVITFHKYTVLINNIINWLDCNNYQYDKGNNFTHHFIAIYFHH